MKKTVVLTFTLTITFCFTALTFVSRAQQPCAGITSISAGNVSRNYHTVVVPKNNKGASVNSVNAQAAQAVAAFQAANGAVPPGYFVIGDGAVIGPKQ